MTIQLDDPSREQTLLSRATVHCASRTARDCRLLESSLFLLETRASSLCYVLMYVLRYCLACTGSQTRLGSLALSGPRVLHDIRIGTVAWRES
jgi:hypothetical protein